MEYQAILFDTRSIQHYIFSGSRLKTNIGASYLVDRIYDDVLLDVLKSDALFGADGVDDTTWKNDDAPDWQQQETPCRIAYFGGGNALVLLKDDAKARAKDIVTAFTKALLVRAPGLRTGAAIGSLRLASDGTIGAEDGIDDLTRLVHQLKETQSTIFPQVTLPYTGLTLCCPESDAPAAAWDDDERRFYAWDVERKLCADRKAGGEEPPAERELLQKLRSVLPEGERRMFLDGYAFPQSFSQLGQKTTENYLAIVHIDGNNMGVRFARCRTLTERKNLSRRIRATTIRAFAALVRAIIRTREAGADAFLARHVQDGRDLLPIRPLVLGGDDMTFVCAAKTAFTYTPYLMRAMNADGIASCAGIAILKSSYPFSRGYEMAEELCGAAKTAMRKTPGDSCWLDFAFLHGEQPPTLEGLRAQEYRTAYRDGEVPASLHAGPYRVDADESDAHAYQNLLRATAELPRCLPMNKIKELRSVLAHGAHEQQAFLSQLAYLSSKNAAHAHLPAIPAWKGYKNGLWQAGRTPFVDAIELMDYYVPQLDETMEGGAR